MRYPSPGWLHRPAVAVAGIVAVSAAIRFAIARSFEAPWIVDEMMYGLIGRTFWATGHLSALGQAAAGYGAYPIVVGLPLHLVGPTAGVTTIQASQTVLMSLTAAVVWAWARPFTGDRWALVAAALTACLPALAYSGLLMTEAVFLPAGALALWLAAGAIVRPSRARQFALVGAIVVATAVRLQGAILVPIFVTTALLAAWFARDPRLLARLTPTWITLVGLGALWVAIQLAVYGSLDHALGAYGVTASAGYDAGDVARWMFREAGDLYVLVLGIPLVAMGVLAYGAARGRELDAGVRALIAVSLSTSLWLTVQIGAFASRYVGGLAERNLIVAAPPLLVCLAVWLARGLPRPQPATSIIAVAVAVPALLLPVRLLVSPFATPNAFMAVPFARLDGIASRSVVELVWTLGAAALVVAAVIVPRRAAAVIPIVLGLALVGASALASSEVGKLTHTDRERFFGTAAETWVDDAATSPVLYVAGAGTYWNGIWKTAFWNDRIRRVASLPGSITGTVPADNVVPGFDGRLLDVDGHPLRDRAVVAPTEFTFFGDLQAEIAQVDLDQSGLRLWRTPGGPALSTWTNGLKPNGDIVQPVQMRVFACDRGALELTLLGKQGTPVEIDLDGRLAARVTVAPGGVWSGSIPTANRPSPEKTCNFEIRSSGLVGSTRLEFVRS